jgi:hypothetical protein
MTTIFSILFDRIAYYISSSAAWWNARRRRWRSLSVGDTKRDVSLDGNLGAIPSANHVRLDYW